VLVPLCGKTEDLAFLAAHGHEVVGIELVEEAVRAFFDEHATTAVATRHEACVEYRAGMITIFAGDVFAVTRELAGQIDALYDRAALVALPPDVRPRYVKHLRALIEPAAPGLVVTLEYPDEGIAGPPFAVREPEVRELYAGQIELLEEATTDTPHKVPGIERCFAVTL